MSLGSTQKHFTLHQKEIVAGEYEAMDQTLVNQPLDLAGRSVLVVDDDPGSRDLFSLVFEEYGAEVLAVASADAALEKLEQLRPDILISDIVMPWEDGYSLIRKVRALEAERGREIPVIALSAHLGRAAYRQAISAGFQNYLTKPTNLDQLVMLVASLTENLYQLDRLYSD